MVRMLCSLYYAEHSATMSLSFPRKNITANAKSLGIAKMMGVQTRTEMWWTWPCCWHVISSLLRGGGQVFLYAVHPLTRLTARAPCLTSERLRYKDKTLLDWTFPLQVCGNWGSEVQKARRGISSEKQGSSELWVVAFSCLCAASWREFYFPFISVMGLEAFMAGAPSVQLWTSYNLVSLWAMCLSLSRQARIGNQGTSLGKMSDAPQLHTYLSLDSSSCRRHTHWFGCDPEIPNRWQFYHIKVIPRDLFCLPLWVIEINK